MSSQELHPSAHYYGTVPKLPPELHFIVHDPHYDWEIVDKNGAVKSQGRGPYEALSKYKRNLH